MMSESRNFSRKDFFKVAGVGGAAALFAPKLAACSPDAAGSPGAASRRHVIGSTFILWGYSANNLEPALRDMARLGYPWFETFGQTVEEWENNRGGFRPVMERYGVPMVSAFCMADVLDPANTRDEVEKLVRWSGLVRENGGRVIEFCPNSMDRSGYDYRDYADHIIYSMNEYARAITDQGLVCALHPHTETAIETGEETYFAMENVDTEYMKFGPDSGQLEKAGADTVAIFRDFLPLIEHVHLKDYVGGEDNGYLGYCPLGEGQVDLVAILDMLEQREELAGEIMFELDYDGSRTAPYAEYVAAKISRDYLLGLGYQFAGGDAGGA